MGLVIFDPFVESSGDVTLASHNPSNGGGTGTSWTRQELVNTTNLFEIKAADDNISNDTVGSRDDARYVYTVSPDPTAADVDVEITVDVLADSSNDPLFLLARFTDKDNWYALAKYRSGSPDDIRIYKRTAGATPVPLKVEDVGLSVNAVIKFELRGITLKGYIDNVLKITITDSDHTAAGKCGVALGNLAVSTDDLNHKWALDDFTVTEFPSGNPHFYYAQQ